MNNIKIKKLKNILFKLFIPLILYVAGVFLLFIFQEKLIYHPNDQIFSDCNFFIGAESVEYNGTRMYVKDLDKPVAILYHGNAGSACDRSFYSDMFTSADYGYVIVEYAGYSNDPKNPSTDLIKKDVDNVISYLNESGVGYSVVIGESIGTGFATYHASKSQPNKLILISPFTNMRELAAGKFLFYPTRFLVKNNLDNVDALKNFKNKVLIIHGDKDEVIPYELGKKLFESMQADKEFLTIKGFGHNNLFSSPETYTAIISFLKTK